MKKTIILLSLFLICCSHNPYKNNSRAPQSQSQKPELLLEKLKYANRVSLRTGAMLEAVGTIFKGCVLYLEGLGDSILNHDELFQALSASGYRVITFDYMGQGGSDGLMNDTRLGGQSYKQIGSQARWLWDYRSRAENAINGRTCDGSKKLVIGWSTGGLAAYRLAFEKWADAVVLIAPGINPKWMVGEARSNPLKAFRAISERTLTRNTFDKGPNPHVDPIKPDTPLKVPAFATSLMLTAHRSQGWRIDENIKGLVFLSGVEDSYVDRDATIRTLNANAHHFDIVSYDGALHELDNETPEVASDLRLKIIDFFDRTLNK